MRLKRISPYVSLFEKFASSRPLICNHHQTYRQGPEVFCKKGVLRNFAKFTGKHLCQSLFLNKIAGLRSATLLKKRL